MSEWTLNQETSTYAIETHGGVLTLHRREDTGKLEGNFIYTYPLAEDAEEDAVADQVEVVVPLHDVERVATAQAQALIRLTDHLTKSGYTFHNAPTVAEEEDGGEPDAI